MTAGLSQHIEYLNAYDFSAFRSKFDAVRKLAKPAFDLDSIAGSAEELLKNQGNNLNGSSDAAGDGPNDDGIVAAEEGSSPTASSGPSLAMAWIPARITMRDAKTIVPSALMTTTTSQSPA